MAAIAHDDGKRYELVLAVVMPDHAHILLRPLDKNPGEWHDLAQIIKLIKGVSAHRINQLTGRSGQVWLSERYDKIIRDEAEFQVKIDYMLNNPVKAQLVANSDD